MKCRVKITQVLEGYVDLDVDRPEDALMVADDLYRRQGMELPDMDDVNPLQFSLEEILEHSADNTNKVFLAPSEGKFWSAIISAYPPDQSAVLLTAEQNYPAEVYFDRLDINGSSVTERCICEDRKALLETLNWIGACGHTPLALWDFDIDNLVEEKLFRLLENTYEKKCRLLQGIDLEETEIIDAEKGNPDLQEKLTAAKEAARNQAKSSQAETNEMEH